MRQYTLYRTPLIKALFAFLFVLISHSQYAQSKLEILQAGSLKFDETLGKGAKRLIGDVQLKHDNILLFCDSAYFYTDNSIDAYGHVHIKQDDSIHLYGDFLNYNGDSKKAIIKRNVIVDKGDMLLTTNKLYYTVKSSVGYYNTSGKITNKDNTLTSKQGYFYAKTNDVFFKRDVVLIHQEKDDTVPEFVINCDTMRYNTASKITYFYGPTTITNDDALIYCENGWYDTEANKSQFTENGYILSAENKLIGDSVFYDANDDIGIAKGNVQLIDTVKKLRILGEYGIHYQNDGLSIVTDSALLIKMFDADTLFMHADTLKLINDSVSEQRVVAYSHVKFFKPDLQGKCDSLTYLIKDSTMVLNGLPVVWYDEHQLTADTLSVFMGDGNIKGVELARNSFILSNKDSIHFNQIRGKDMEGVFKDNELYLINVTGNGQTIYYVDDENEEKVDAVNFVECSDIDIYLDDNEISRILFKTKPDAVLSPLDQLEHQTLKGFNWRKTERPAVMMDVYKNDMFIE